MTDSTEDPPPSSPDGPASDDDAPVSEPPPSTPPAPGPALPPSTGIQVTRELTDAFLRLKTTQARIRTVAVSRLGGKKAPPDRVDEVVQQANEKALRTTRLADTPEQLRPWVATLTANAAIDFLRRQGVHDARFGTDVNVDELPPDPMVAPDEPAGDDAGEDDGVEWRDQAPGAKLDPAMVGPWVDGAVEARKGNKERDRTVLEMIRYKANHPGMTDAQVAATFGMTPEAYESRLRRFRGYYVPLRKRYVKRRNTIIVILLGAAVVALVAWLLWPHRPPPSISADPSISPIPSTSASVEPEHFNNALPPDDEGKKPKPPR